MTGQPARRILVGKIATAHGVRGLVKVHVMVEDPLLLAGPLFTSEDGDETITISMKNSAGKYWIAEVPGISDRNDAEALRHKELWMDYSRLPDADDGEYYAVDLVGMRVIDDQGAVVGKVIALQDFGAGDLLEVKPPKGDSFYIPFADEYILDIDDEEDLIVASIPEGLR